MRRSFFNKHQVIYYLIYIPLCIILLGWGLIGQSTVIIGSIWGWSNDAWLALPGWIWVIYLFSALFGIPFYGTILVCINYWLQDMNDEEKELDRAWRSNVHYPNPDITNLEREKREIHQKYHPQLYKDKSNKEGC
jgi:hypothetical protein